MMSNETNPASALSAQQLALELPTTSLSGRQDLVKGAANATAVELMDAWPDWPGLLVVLAGPVGSGKSHIARAWAKNAAAITCPMQNLVSLGEERASSKPLLLEDASADSIDETTLFHILNAKRAANASVIITSRSWPGEWDISLEDLNSRLRAAQLVEIGEPDDELLQKVLYKLFADRQLPIESGVVDYLVVRMERSLEAANRLVEQLDATALAQHRKITRQLASEVLKAIESIGESAGEGTGDGAP